MARRSARLASVATTPQKEHTTDLGAVVKQQEQLSSHKRTKKLRGTMSSPAQCPRTPMAATVIKPPMSEMHPSKAHVGTMAAPSSALRLGFTDIKPKDGPGKGLASLLSTPSKFNISSPPSGLKFEREVATASDQTFGADAQKIMEEIREEAVKIKAELLAKRRQERLEEAELAARKIAQPKKKAGRFSEIHMAEFRKMDSIADHPSAFRALHGRTTSAIEGNSKGLKRSQSKANIDENEASNAKIPAPASIMKSSHKTRTPGKAFKSPAKRAKQSPSDDVSTNRSVPKDESRIPQPKTPGKAPKGVSHAKTPSHTTTPIQSSLSHAAFTQSLGPRSILKNSTRVDKSASITEADLTDTPRGDEPADITCSSLSDRVRSILAKYQDPAQLSKSLGGSKTPAPARAQTELPPAPFTTPGKKVARRIDFTSAPKLQALVQNSPSLLKTSISLPETSDSVHYPTLKKVTQKATDNDVSYPDLSSVRPLSELPTPIEAMDLDTPPNREAQAPVSVPGTFTFRSDHTISFGSEPQNGFGINTGQASIRQVRRSIAPSSNVFPPAIAPVTDAPQGKENVHPQAQKTYDAKAFAHGVSSKKRCRAEDDEQEAEREAAERAVKKKKSAAVPEGDALLAPRLTAARRGPASKAPSKFTRRSAVKTNSAASPAAPPKKPTTLSKSRLAYLAQPKQRK